jgi:hypothetical protein
MLLDARLNHVELSMQRIQVLIREHRSATLALTAYRRL